MRARSFRKHGDPVVVVTPAPVNAFGDTIDGGADQRRPLGLGAFAPGGTSEDTLTRGDTVTTTATLYLDHDAVVKATDVVEVRGQRWYVDGDPQRWRSPFTGTLGPLEVRLRKVTG